MTIPFDSPSIGSVLTNLFPNGTVPAEDPGFKTVPYLPTDIFAAVAYLLERGGVYHRLVPESISATYLASVHPAPPPFVWPPPNIVLTKKEIDECKLLGAALHSIPLRLAEAEKEQKFARSKSGQARALANIKKIRTEFTRRSAELQEIWDELVRCHSLPLVKRPVPDLQAWWRPAVRLLIISDESSSDIGYQSGGNVPIHPVEAIIRRAVFGMTTLAIPISSAHPLHEKFQKKSDSFTVSANTFMARVVPKGRTSPIGCSMRNLSRNLALVPPHGIVDLNWFREIKFFHEDREPLNLVIVPFPFRIDANCFESKSVSGDDQIAGSKKWGWFGIAQRWLNRDSNRPQPLARDKTGSWDIDNMPPDESRADIANFLLDLIEQAKRDCGRVHGLLLPELALDWATYSVLIEKLCETPASGNSPLVDFVVCGTSSNEWGAAGNYVLTTTFSLDDKNRVRAFTYSRAKHHRWELSRSQITEYAIASALDPNIVWLEGNELPRREIDLTVFRRGAIFSAMICEDLARSDPCHDPLRAVGPNLVFVLLMDGPQLPTRWSTRYATALADDPGSSVLTLTSLGLIERNNKSGRHPPCRSIGIWKEDTQKTVSLDCPVGYHGVLITLAGEEAVEHTIDGRSYVDAQAWRYQGHQPIRVLADVVKTRSYGWIFA
jgi:hypothetical protein